MPDERDQASEAAKAATVGEAAEDGLRVAVERVGPAECTIRIEAEVAYLRERYQKELTALQAEVALPGFRKGKAPAGLVERRMGSTLRSDLVSSVVSEAYDKAVEEHDLEVVGHTDEPDLDALSWEPGQPIEVEYRCEVLPQVELDEQQYKGLEAEVPAFAVTDEMFADGMERFARQFSTFEEAEGAVDWDDYVEADVSVAGVDLKEQIGFHPRSERIGPFAVEGMKGALADAKVGDTVEVDAELQEDAAGARPELEELVGRSVKLSVALQVAMRRKVPALDDELARKIGMESVADVEAVVRDRLEESVKEETERATRDAVCDALLRSVDVELPSGLVDRAAANENLRLLLRLLRAGVPREEAERRARAGRERQRDVVEQRLKVSYLLRQVAERERIIVTESEVDSQVRAFSSRQGWREERARSYMEERGMVRELRADMRESRTIDFLIEHARIREVAQAESAGRHGEPESEKGTGAEE